MAANNSQGRSFGLFLTGLTTACAGIAVMPGGLGVALLIVGLVILVASFAMFIKIKPLEGKPALGAQPAVMKLVGSALSAGGWIVALFGLHLTSSVGGRMAFAIIGLAISLVGVVVILPSACNKNAIWKA
ncbi:MAG TPA: hypothetical protein VMU92_12935 [Acidobacteriaceae bacterium]|nr:hypothetical protein [Acidobacteriaceae bacterium]